MTDQDENEAIRMARDDPVFIASGDHPAHIPSPIEGFSCSANASNASIVDQLAAPGAADIEFGAPASGRLFRAPDFS
jgi:hypothetical protein